MSSHLRPVVPAVAFAALLVTLSAAAHDVRLRRPVRIPDVPGFVTLQCDFHAHTVFSDGQVWPDVRAEEAWREGYDAIAITDHVEYLPHRGDLPPNHERSWEIAAPHGERLGLIVVRGAEVTRKMPPGHFNALFVASVCPLETPEWKDALRAARDQGAFIVWNHPAWRGHQKDGVARWYPEHDVLLAEGLLHGIEVVNNRDYSPEAHRWALEKGLTVIAGSDVHDPSNLAWHVDEGEHRPVTLVFARERSEAAIREALFARRTVAFSGEMLAGREELLRPLVEAALAIENPRLAVRAGDEGYLRVRNGSGFRLELEREGPEGGIGLPSRVVVASGGTSLVSVRVPKATAPRKVRVETAWRITNARISPEEGLSFPLSFDLEVLPAKP